MLFPPIETLSVVCTVVNPPDFGVFAPIVVPSIAPPSISTAFLFCTAMVPSPRIVLAEEAFEAVITPTIGAELEPVPPRVIGTIPEVISCPFNDK